MVNRSPHCGTAKHDSVGFTLIELIVTLALMTIVVMAVSPLTLAWTYISQVNDTVSVLQMGFSKTKTAAFRNGQIVSGTMPAAYFCISTNVMYVHEAMPATCGTGSIWKANVPGNALVQNGNVTFACIALSNNGLPVSGTIGGTSCSMSKIFTISKGGQSVVKNII